MYDDPFRYNDYLKIKDTIPDDVMKQLAKYKEIRRFNDGAFCIDTQPKAIQERREILRELNKKIQTEYGYAVVEGFYPYTWLKPVDNLRGANA